MAAKLTRLHSLRERLGATFSSHPNELIALFSRMGGSRRPSGLLPAVVGPSQRQPVIGRRAFAAAPESTSISVSEIPLGGSGNFPPPPGLSSASSSPSHDTATRTPFSTAENDARSEESVRTSRSAPEATATTTDHEDALKLLIAINAINVPVVLFIKVKDISSSWKTKWQVLYAIILMLSFLSTVISLLTAKSDSWDWARTTLSPFCARFGLLVVTALFIFHITCPLGTYGWVAEVATAALVVLALAVVWWKCSSSTKPAGRVDPAPAEAGALL